MPSEYRWFLGVDWGSQQDQLYLLQEGGTVLAQRAVRHQEHDIAECVRWLSEVTQGELGAIAVAIERPHCALADSLAAEGAAIFHVNPKQMDRLRDRYSPAGAKDDRRDAFVLADSLRLQPRGFLRVLPEDPLLVQLRATSRLDEQLQVQATRLANQLYALLSEVWPELLALCPAANEPWLWSLLQLAPTQKEARGLRRQSLATLLRKHHVRRLDAATLAKTLRQTPISVQPGRREATALQLRLLAQQVTLLEQQRKTCGQEIDALLEALASPEEGEIREHRDVAILCSMPGAGRRVAAAVLAEAPHAVARRDYQRLRVLCGLAPVTKRSGRSCHVIMRRACNYRLRNACFHWAMNAIRLDTNSRAHYAALRQRGHGHARALRSVADRNLRILVAMLADGSCYRLAA